MISISDCFAVAIYWVADGGRFMKCPFCQQINSKVIDTRVQKEGGLIRRRRECIDCRGRFSTQETYLQSYPYIIKKDGRIEPYAPEKVLKGIQAACQKRPISLAQMDNIVERVTHWIISRNEREISSQLIGIKVMHEIQVLDDIAYVRFASVYKTFKDVKDFIQSMDSQLRKIRSDENESWSMNTEEECFSEDLSKLTPPPSE